MKPRILLAGLGETGMALAARLSANWDVIGIDPQRPALAGQSSLQQAAKHGSLRLLQGDATSALVLSKAGLDGILAAVACTGSDEVNLEVLRLARQQHGITNRIALMYSRDWEDRYNAEEIDVVDQDLACASILEARIQRGIKVATSVGLGMGEVVEVEVLPSSSVIGRKLAELHPRRWLVAAVYRQRELIVPHGDTELAAGDRVLLVGEPDILPAIATLVRTGEPEFPLQYGSHIVGLCGPRTARLLEETAYLLEVTRAERFEAIACRGQQQRLQDLARRCAEAGIRYETTCSAQDTVASLLEEHARRDVGVLILPPEPLPLRSRIGLGRSATARIIDMAGSPVLIARSTFPYRRILLVLAELPFRNEAAHLAIDVVRTIGAELHLGLVHQPNLVVGPELRDEMEERRREVENLAGLYHVEVRTRVLEGNPIAEICKASRDFDLLVLPYRKGRKAFLTRPDVGLNLIHRAHCSVMVMPV